MERNNEGHYTSISALSEYVGVFLTQIIWNSVELSQYETPVYKLISKFSGDIWTNFNRGMDGKSSKWVLSLLIRNYKTHYCNGRKIEVVKYSFGREIVGKVDIVLYSIARISEATKKKTFTGRHFVFVHLKMQSI